MFAISTYHYQADALSTFVNEFKEKGIYNFEFMADKLVIGKNVPQKPCRIANLALPIPAQDQLAQLPSLASVDEKERQQAMDNLLAAMQKSRQLKVPYLVIWPGYVPIPQFADIADEDQAQLLQKRKQIAPAAIERLCRSLFAVCQQEPDIRLCIPPARTCLEIPLAMELEWIISDLGKYQIYYWHHSGNCYLHEKMQLADAEQWLHLYQKRLAGVYLQDAADDQFLLPGMGQVNFSDIKNYMVADTIRVLPAHPRFSNAEIWQACQYLREIGMLLQH